MCEVEGTVVSLSSRMSAEEMDAQSSVAEY